MSIALGAAGATMVYAGLRGVSPLDALREIATGGPRPVGTGGSPAAGSIADRNAKPAYQGSANAAEHTLTTGSGTLGNRLAGDAMQYVGRKYRLGATGPDAFDCSGLVQRAFRDIGVPDCPRTSGMQLLWRKLGPLSQFDSSYPMAGDLAFWPGHVVILTSATTFVGAQNPRRGVTTGQLSTAGPPGAGAPVIRRYHG